MDSIKELTDYSVSVSNGIIKITQRDLEVWESYVNNFINNSKRCRFDQAIQNYDDIVGSIEEFADYTVKRLFNESLRGKINPKVVSDAAEELPNKEAEVIKNLRHALKQMLSDSCKCKI